MRVTEKVESQINLLLNNLHSDVHYYIQLELLIYNKVSRIKKGICKFCAVIDAVIQTWLQRKLMNTWYSVRTAVIVMSRSFPVGLSWLNNKAVFSFTALCAIVLLAFVIYIVCSCRIDTSYIGCYSMINVCWSFVMTWQDSRMLSSRCLVFFMSNTCIWILDHIS